jgi:sorbitol-6-phosphate 2-dehydrogenase
MNPSFYAPLIRGAVIGKTKAPCVVKAVESADVNELFASDALTVKLDGGVSEAEVISAIAGAIKKCASVPKGLSVESDGKVLHFAIETYVGAKPRASVVDGRVALVTGGAQGFGEEIVRGLCGSGARVFVADLNITGAKALAEKLNAEYGGTVRNKITADAVEVNVGDEASVEKAFDYIARSAGGIDLCVSNAGVLRAASVLEQDIESFRFVTNINYVAFTIITKHCALLMKRQHLASKAAGFTWPTDIIQINSKSGLDGSNKNAAYAGSKFGGLGLVQSFAKELVDWGIKVNAVCPGNFLNGPLWSDPEKGLFVQYLKTGKVPGAKTVDDVRAFYESKVPMGRGCEGGDVLKAIYYLVDQQYETGQALPVTGGQVMLN